MIIPWRLLRGYLTYQGHADLHSPGVIGVAFRWSIDLVLMVLKLYLEQPMSWDPSPYGLAARPQEKAPSVQKFHAYLARPGPDGTLHCRSLFISSIMADWSTSSRPLIN